MLDALQGFLALLPVAAAVAAIAIVGIIAFRPAWAHLEYDALLWKFAIADTKAWVYDKTKAEVFVLLGTFVVGFVQDAPSLGARILNGLAISLNALLVGAPLLLVWAYVNAAWKVYETAKSAPHNEMVTFWPFVELNTLQMQVRNRLNTGDFAAQLWLIEGVSDDQKHLSLGWNDSPRARREIVSGHEESLRLLRVDTEAREGAAPLTTVTLYVAGDAELGQRRIHPTHDTQEGQRTQWFNPIVLRMEVTDPEGVKRPVKLWVSIKVSGVNVTIVPLLLREY